MNKNITKEILQEFTRDRLIEYALALTEGSAKDCKDLERIDEAILDILDGKYVEAIMILIKFYEGYVPESLVENIVSRYSFKGEK